MKIVDYQIFTPRIPFRTAFTHALAARHETSAVIVKLAAEDGTCGYGEATPRPYVTGESIDATRSVLQGLKTQVLGLALPTKAQIMEWIEAWFADHGDVLDPAPNARCALELALLDLMGQVTPRAPARSFLGPSTPRRLTYSAALSEGPLDQTRALLDQIRMAGMRQLKVKVGLDFESARQKIDLARAVLGEDLHLRIDANGAWDLASALDQIPRYLELGIQSFEQPLPASARDDYPTLMQRIDRRAVVMLDESLCAYADARWFVRHRGANGFNLKISKHGGITETLRIYELARRNGIVCQLGCHVGETSLLTAAGLTFAALAGPLTACEGAFGELLLAYDIVRDPIQFGAQGRYDSAPLLDRPGLGVSVNPGLLEKACSERD